MMLANPLLHIISDRYLPSTMQLHPSDVRQSINTGINHHLSNLEPAYNVIYNFTFAHASVLDMHRNMEEG